MKSGFYTTTSDNQLSGWTKKLQSTYDGQTCTKKGQVIVRQSAACLIHYSFLNPGETIASEKYAQQIDEMHRKLQCMQPALVNRAGPVFLHDSAWPHTAQPSLQKLNELVFQVLPHLLYSPDLSPIDYHLKHLDNLFAGKMLPQPAGGRKCFPIVGILKHGFLDCRDKLICWQKCVDCNGFQLINKNVYEPSYNDLKFTVWNHNYFCTNLIISL